jgi:predicted ATPase
MSISTDQVRREPFVGHKAELDQLLDAVIQGEDGRGRMVLVEGRAGMGKTTLLRKLQERAGEIGRLQKARFAHGNCYLRTGFDDAYAPLVEIMQTLLLRDERSDANDKSLLLRAIVEEVAPDLLLRIPGGTVVQGDQFNIQSMQSQIGALGSHATGVVGGAVSADVKAVVFQQQRSLAADADMHAGLVTPRPFQYVSALTEIAAHFAPLVLMIEDAHQIDDASCQVLIRLAPRLSERPLVVVVTYRPEDLNDQHSFQSVREELLSSGFAQDMTLTGWDEDQVKGYVQERYGRQLNPNLAAWLVDLCDGQPLFVTHYLTLLEQDCIIRFENGGPVLDGGITKVAGNWEPTGLLASNAVPDEIEKLLDQRVNRVDRDDREMLQVGAVQGEHFMSVALSDLLEKEELAILAQLRRVKEQHGIIELYRGDELPGLKSQVYTFESILMQQAFYRRLDPGEHQIRHLKIAQWLEAILRGQGRWPRRFVLEIARHYDRADEPLAAAQYYHLAAQSSFVDGASVEATTLCWKALKRVRALPEDGAEHDRLRAQIIQLLLLSSELRWRGRPELQRELSLSSLVQEAEEAASRAGDLALVAWVKYVTGKILVITESRTRAISVLQEALQFARNANDPECEFVVLSELGHQTVGENLAAGVQLLHEANRLFDDRLSNAAGPDANALKRRYWRLKSLIGVAEFDGGNFDAAVKWLQESIDGLRKTKSNDDLLFPMNFLGQTYMAMGLFEQAEEVIKESLELFKREESVIARIAYNRSILGKLYLEWERLDEAAQVLKTAYAEIEATWDISVMLLVRNYYSELLIHPEYPGRDPAEAERQLRTTVEESLASGYYRSAVVALSLLGRLALMRGEIEAAVSFSTEAVNELRARGTLPALRSEEVFFHHFKILEAAGQSSEARLYLEQAHRIVEQKAASIADEQHRHAYLERVPVSRSIRSALTASTQS